MDYEQKYKEALESARKLQENSNGMILKKWLWNIFPELKESEDEKIRKEIIQSIKDNMCVIHKDKCLAWLEKQGEQKPTPKFKIGDTIHKIGENTVFPRTIEKIEDGDYVCNNSHTFVNIKFQDDYELVEQKPAWSEEDEKMFNKIIDELTLYGECPDYPSPEEQEYYYTRQEMVDWLKSLKPNHWKPNEELLKDLPKWKKAHEHKEFPLHLCVMDENMYPFLDTEVNEGDYYIELSDLKTLPKEE